METSIDKKETKQGQADSEICKHGNHICFLNSSLKLNYSDNTPAERNHHFSHNSMHIYFIAQKESAFFFASKNQYT